MGEKRCWCGKVGCEETVNPETGSHGTDHTVGRDAPIRPRRFLGLLCRHEWDILRTYGSKTRALGTDPLDDRSWYDIGKSYDLRCKYCGWIRKVSA